MSETLNMHTPDPSTKPPCRMSRLRWGGEKLRLPSISSSSGSRSPSGDIIQNKRLQKELKKSREVRDQTATAARVTMAEK